METPYITKDITKDHILISHIFYRQLVFQIWLSTLHTVNKVSSCTYNNELLQKQNTLPAVLKLACICSHEVVLTISFYTLRLYTVDLYANGL